MKKQFKKKATVKAFDEAKVIIYDIEVYPNFFSFAYYVPINGRKNVIEISPRKNQIKNLYSFLQKLEDGGWSMVGYNNSDFDWMITDWVWNQEHSFNGMRGEQIAREIYEFNDYWFNTLQKDRNKFFQYRKDNQLWQSSYRIPQIDLFKIHRLDAVKIGLKVIQFNLNCPNITTLPHPPGKVLSYSDMDEVLDYNLNNDVMGTYQFYKESNYQIDFRVAMQDLLGKNFMAASDVKIAEVWFKKELETPSDDIFITNGYEQVDDGVFEKVEEDGYINQLTNRGVETYTYVDEERIVNQTTYPNGFSLKDSLFDCIEFNSPEFKAAHKWFGEQWIYDTEGVFSKLPKEQVEGLLPYANPDTITKDGGMKKLEIMYADIPFVFGLGGIHASVESTYVCADDDYILDDRDVKSYYPSIIAGIWEVLGERFRVHPNHIGEVFCEIVKYVRDIRFKTPKSDPKNLMYKLIMNAFSFGKLNEDNSFVLDPKACMTITVNGQLMLCMLCESIFENTKHTSIIQANTDGATFRIHKSEIDIFNRLCDEWAEKTGLILEQALYDFMAINNVNHYIAKYTSDPVNEKPDSLKAKGQYLTKPTWTQDFSTLAVQKAVTTYFKDNIIPEQSIPENKNAYDFRGRIKIDKRFDLYIFNDANGDKPLFKKIGIGDRVSFQRIIKRNDVHEIMGRLNNDEDFIHYIKTDISESKNIDYDDVDMKAINRRFKSIPSRAKFLGEKFAGEVGVHDRVGKAFVRWYLDNDKKLDMELMRGKKLQTVTAYYMAKKGFYMFKETLPSEDQPLWGKFTGVQSGQKVIPCNNIDDFKFDNIDYDWYIHEAWKLITPIMPEKDKHLSPIWQAEQVRLKLVQEKLDKKTKPT